MSYTAYLIGDYSTGLEKRLQPWLLPDDAQEDLFDGYVYRGVLSKREGYNYFATGLRGGAPYRESRIVHQLTAVPMVGAINSSNRVFTLAGHIQIARGSITITGSTPSQVLVDNGLGAFTGAGTGTVNYLTGAISITFTLAPTAGTVLITYSYYPANPVMMVANFITNTNVRQLIVADTQYVNRYNSTLNILQDISPASPYTGTSSDFFSWTNYPSATDAPRLLFSNNVDPIQQYDGATVTVWPFVSATITTLLASWIVQFKDRLILLRTTENGTVFPQRIRITGFGASCDTLDTSAIGAGFIDIPDQSWIQGAAFNRDDLIIFTESSTWVLKFTGDDSVPFVLNKIDDSRGSQAAFSAYTYLNRTSAASPRGLIISDGYRVERQDLEIPDFCFNEVDGDNFKLCYAGSVDADHDHYLIYPQQNSTISTRILTTNYDEDNYSIYRLPLSCMGTFITAFTITWDDLLAFQNWDQFAASYGDWNHFSYMKGVPFSIGGGHKGEIWRLTVTEEEDNPVLIRNITIVDAFTIQVTTDWNNYNDGTGLLAVDQIFLSGVLGMVQVNGKQYEIQSVTNNNVFRLRVPSTADFAAYVSGGTAVRVIPFQAKMKEFNPFASIDKKVQCGWLYMYVSTSGTDLTRNIPIGFVHLENPARITTTVQHNLVTGMIVSIFNVGGTTEINDKQYTITVIDRLNFTLNGIDATGFTAYTSGGYVAVPVPAKLSVDVFVNDNGERTQVNNLSQDPYQGNCTNIQFETGTKKWYKVYINQTGRFIQFQFRNAQAGAQIHIHAMMPGFKGVGRLL